MNISVLVKPKFLSLTESDVEETDITLHWYADPSADPYELVVKNQTGFVEPTYHTNQSGTLSKAICFKISQSG